MSKKIFARVKVAQGKPHFFTAKSNVAVSGPGKIFGAKNIAMVCANEKNRPPMERFQDVVTT
ncbi:MAG: hypothetical protein KQH63_11065 [Desulfobulbaceae bacterium]|nr:hypothetical protein [Desulfobulbaceae bacterium]